MGLFFFINLVSVVFHLVPHFHLLTKVSKSKYSTLVNPIRFRKRKRDTRYDKCYFSIWVNLLAWFYFCCLQKRLKNRKQAERFAHVDIGNYTHPFHFFSNSIIKNGLSIFFFFRYYENHKHGFCYMAVESQRGLLSGPLQQSSCSVTAAMFLEGPQ